MIINEDDDDGCCYLNKKFELKIVLFLSLPTSLVCGRVVSEYARSLCMSVSLHVHGRNARPASELQFFFPGVIFLL